MVRDMIWVSPIGMLDMRKTCPFIILQYGYGHTGMGHFLCFEPCPLINPSYASLFPISLLCVSLSGNLANQRFSTDHRCATSSRRNCDELSPSHQIIEILMVGRLTATITSTATNYLIIRLLLPPRQFSLRTMYSGRGSNSSSSAGTSASFGRGREHLNMGGNRGGSKGHVHGGALGTSKRIDTLGRLLVRILRHGAMELNLDMRSDGYVKLRELLKLNMKTRSNIPLSLHSIDEIREAVRIDNKQRLALLEEDGELWIRANQGHSVKSVETENLLEPIISAEEIPVCIHGTYKRLLEPILASGLKRMNRLHIHFARGLPSDGEVISGMRRDVNLLIFIDTKKAMEDGMKFYKSENEVLLTEGFDGVVPAKYFQKIESWPNRKPVPFQVQVI